ncbi:hypothetical protein niasHT_009480 [Heterodera trifolii]|uniref:Uncharacterized protein n=1 Tax=Heterodera trifolii TaxID=157864 RepID=A0ABD2M721_9BILA
MIILIKHRHRRAHSSAINDQPAVAGRHAVGPPMPLGPPRRNGCPLPIVASHNHPPQHRVGCVGAAQAFIWPLNAGDFVKEKENWAAGRFSRRVPPRPLRRTAGAEQHGLVIPLDRFRTKNFSRRPNNDAFDSSDDEYYDEGDFERRRPERFDWHARRYSTSDLTTSDSELGRLGTGK